MRRNCAGNIWGRDLAPSTASVAVGSALTKTLNSDTKTVYCLCGDGELQEGQIWEAIMYAGSKHVNNLILAVDVNRQQICGSTDNILSLGNLKTKFSAFNWKVLEVANGNNIESVLNALNTAKNLKSNGQPVCILLNTEMGYGVDYMMGSHKWHGIAPNDEQLQKALDQLEETLGDY